MLSHVTLGSRDLDRSATFYRALAPRLGLVERMVEPGGGPLMLCWHRPGRDVPRLYVTRPFDGAPASAGNGTMIGLVAPNRADVDGAHAAGLSAGGVDEGAPGLRAHYAPDYYGAYLRDPDGNKICLVHRPALVAALA